MVNPLSITQNAYKLGRVAIVLIILLSVTFAEPASSTATLQQAMAQLCRDARTLLAAGAMILIVLAAAVYAIGQVVGAETRARASVWATSMLVGAVIGIVIYLIVPALIETLMGDYSLGSSDDPCGVTDGA